jgi:hypothetical protein
MWPARTHVFHTSRVPRANRTSPCAGGGIEHAIATLCRTLEFAIDQHYDVRGALRPRHGFDYLVS